MQPSLPSWSTLFLTTGLILLPTAQDGNKKKQPKPKQDTPVIQLDDTGPEGAKPKGWDRFFDYSRLQPSNEEFWAPLSQTQVPLEKALAVAAETEHAPIHVLFVELAPKPEGAVWYMRLFVGDGKERPKRVNLEVSTAEPTVVHRLELLSVAPDEEEAWTVLAGAQVSAEIAAGICIERSKGQKVEPTVTDPRVRKIAFVPTAGNPSWDCELMGFEKELPRRYSFEVSAERPQVRKRLMLDRFPGTPLRSGKPTELENGLYLYDFEAGDGPLVTAESKVKIHYRLFLLDNTKIYDTLKTNQPETFVVSALPLKGMTEGMIGMRVGGKRKIAMPYTMAFGEKGNELAPAKAMVVCDVIVVELF